MTSARHVLARWETAANVVLVLAAVCMAITFMHREFAGARPIARPSDAAPVLIADWDSVVAQAIPISAPEEAPVADKPRVVVAVFSDLECPFCAQLHRELTARPSGDGVTLLFLHYPLGMHRFARPAAVRAECALAQERFAPFVARVYETQDSLGLKPWSAVAWEAGVRDLAAFDACAADAEGVQRIDAHVRLGRRVGVGGTPTVIVNGWRFPRPPSREALDSAIRSMRVGQKPGAANDLFQ